MSSMTQEEYLWSLRVANNEAIMEARKQISDLQMKISFYEQDNEWLWLQIKKEKNETV